MIIGDRHAHRDLAIVLLAELAAVLSRHADRVRSFLGTAGVVNNPGQDLAMAFHGGQYLLADDAEHGLVWPISIGHQMVRRLVRRLHSCRRHARPLVQHSSEGWEAISRCNTIATARSACPSAVVSVST